MRVRPLLLVAITLVLLPATVAPIERTVRVDGPDRLPLPTTMVALGDSITRAYNACGRYEDCPERSWSTGTEPGLGSQYQRLLAISPGIAGRATNLARSGARIDDLVRQATDAVTRGPDYVTILLGANDVCTSSPDTMTSVEDFRARLDAGLRVLATNLPRTRVFIASIPDLMRLWEVKHRDRVAQVIWYVGALCPSMLADARNVDEAASVRRRLVRQRVIDFNAQLRTACQAYGRLCRYDDDAVFDHLFSGGDVSSWDAFHPDLSGQTVIAEVTSTDGFDW